MITGSGPRFNSARVIFTVSPKFNLDLNNHSAAASSDLVSVGAAAGIYAHIADAVVQHQL